MVDVGKEGGVGGGHGCAGDVDGRVEGGVGDGWAAREAVPRRRWCLWLREQCPSPHCRQKRLSPHERAREGEGGSKNPGPRIAIPPPYSFPHVSGGRCEEERRWSLSSASPKATKSPCGGASWGGRSMKKPRPFIGIHPLFGPSCFSCAPANGEGPARGGGSILGLAPEPVPRSPRTGLGEEGSASGSLVVTKSGRERIRD